MSDRTSRPVPAHGRRFWNCFGGLAFASAVLIALSGVFLAFYYRPTPDHAYASVFYISHYVRYGWLVRSVHAWGARLMVALVFIHMLRVLVTRSYRHPRELNWIAGVALLTVTAAFALTGILLPFDQRGYAAATVALDTLRHAPLVGQGLTEFLAGGSAVGAPTLTRFFALHVTLLPALLAALLVAHFRAVRKHGISEPL